ncbi:hypothetical protein A9Z06_33765 [Rhizobium sp. YK2]|nr:hypothetical protein A9Z06_33765 [Rhizobium sp. YK2]
MLLQAAIDVDDIADFAGLIAGEADEADFDDLVLPRIETGRLSVENDTMGRISRPRGRGIRPPESSQLEVPSPPGTSAFLRHT